MDIRIDTLHLQVGGMDQDTARRFARLVAERLGAALATWPAAPGPGLADAGLAAPAGPAIGPDAGGPGLGPDFDVLGGVVTIKNVTSSNNQATNGSGGSPGT